MNIPQIDSTNISTVLVDYIPAELKINKDWMIVYYVLDPFTNKLVRKRKRVPAHNRTSERKKLATRIISTINKKLQKGWNPIIEDEAPKSLTKIVDTIVNYKRILERDFETGEIRFDTKKTYTSVINRFKIFIEESDNDNVYVLNFTSLLISDYLDFLYLKKRSSTTTYNNHLKVLRLFSNFLLQKGYIKNNPTLIFKNKKPGPKKRTIIEKEDINKIFNYLDTSYPAFSLLNKMIYYCYIRPTELTKIKVKDINILSQTIYLSAEVSKKTAGHVTIPKLLINEIVEHIKNASNNDYVFSKKKFTTGKEPSSKSLLYKNWVRNVVDKRLTDQPMYSLKDSGITFALDAGISTVSVMNQARHTDLKTTTAYVRKNRQTADVNIKDSNW